MTTDRNRSRSTPKPDDLIYDWNEVKRRGAVIPSGFKLVDETLRDGIQSPSVHNPSIEDKLRILRLMDRCGIEVADVGLPGAGAEAVADCVRLVNAIVEEGMAIQPNCAARTHTNDIAAVCEVAQKTGQPVEICAFLGSSPVRRLIEGWDLQHMVGLVTTAADMARKEGLPFSFVTEDTTRSSPTTLEPLFRAAIYNGASRLILCDTVGHATPDGLANLLDFARAVIASSGADVAIDWHGHNDRGLSLTLCLSALEYGIDRVHGTCLGVGERVGNASMDQLLINLKLLGIIDRDLSALAEYVETVSTAYGVPVPRSYPVFGHDAFRTATGVHAAAIVKALSQGRDDLADKVYSSVPAADFGCEQVVEVGYYSGRANVHYWLHMRDIEATPERVSTILDAAKAGRDVLTDAQIEGILRNAGLWQA